MRLLLAILLALCMALQPVMSQYVLGCERVSATAVKLGSGPALRSCCGPGKVCGCRHAQSGGCCEVSPGDRPAVPERPRAVTNPSPWQVAAPVFLTAVLFTTASSPAQIAWGEVTAPRRSIDSIQSLLCVWRT